MISVMLNEKTKQYYFAVCSNNDPDWNFIEFDNSTAGEVEDALKQMGFTHKPVVYNEMAVFLGMSSQHGVAVDYINRRKLL